MVVFTITNHTKRLERIIEFKIFFFFLNNPILTDSIPYLKKKFFEYRLWVEINWK